MAAAPAVPVVVALVDPAHVLVDQAVQPVVPEHQQVAVEHQVEHPQAVVVLVDPEADLVVLPVVPEAAPVVVVPELAVARKVHSVAQAAQCVVDVRANARNVKSLIKCRRRRSVACASARATAKSFVSPVARR